MAYKKKRGTLFVDLETLGLWDHAVIMTMGLTLITDEELKYPHYSYFEFLNKSVEYKYDVIEQVKLFKREVNKKTLEWWKSQGDKASHILKPSSKDRSIKLIIDDMVNYCTSQGVPIDECRIFDRQAFDIKKLHHVHQVNLDGGDYPPWDVQEVWGIETLLKYMSPQENRYGSIQPKEFDDPNFVYHSAACDSALDAYRFYQMMQGQ